MDMLRLVSCRIIIIIITDHCSITLSQIFFINKWTSAKR